MGHKGVCIECRKSLNIGFDNNSERLYPCSKCGRPMLLLPHRFRPPGRTDDKKWEVVKYLIENGFNYQHVYKKIETKNGTTSYIGFVEYPENIRDAKEFVEKYKNQAIK